MPSHTNDHDNQLKHIVHIKVTKAFNEYERIETSNKDTHTHTYTHTHIHTHIHIHTHTYTHIHTPEHIATGD